jgi:hypothetical protein
MRSASRMTWAVLRHDPLHSSGCAGDHPPAAIWVGDRHILPPTRGAKRREVDVRPVASYQWLIGVYASVEATNPPCQVWYQTAPV